MSGRSSEQMQSYSHQPITEGGVEEERDMGVALSNDSSSKVPIEND